MAKKAVIPAELQQKLNMAKAQLREGDPSSHARLAEVYRQIGEYHQQRGVHKEAYESFAMSIDNYSEAIRNSSSKEVEAYRLSREDVRTQLNLEGDLSKRQFRSSWRGKLRRLKDLLIVLCFFFSGFLFEPVITGNVAGNSSYIEVGWSILLFIIGIFFLWIKAD